MWLQKMLRGCAMQAMLKSFASRVTFFGAWRELDQYPPRLILLALPLVEVTHPAEPYSRSKRCMSTTLRLNLKRSSRNLDSCTNAVARALFLSRPFLLKIKLFFSFF